METKKLHYTSIYGRYRVVPLENGYGVYDGAVNMCIVFRYTSGNDFIDETKAVNKASACERADLSNYYPR